MKSSKLLRKKIVEYPLNAIADVIVEKNRRSNHKNYYILAFKIVTDSNYSYLSMSTNFNHFNRAEEMAQIVRIFLDTP